jgi:hypothetical protein
MPISNINKWLKIESAMHGWVRWPTPLTKPPTVASLLKTCVAQFLHENYTREERQVFLADVVEIAGLMDGQKGKRKALSPAEIIVRELRNAFDGYPFFDATAVAAVMQSNPALRVAITNEFPEVGDQPLGRARPMQRLRKALRQIEGLTASHNKAASYWSFRFEETPNIRTRNH